MVDPFDIERFRLPADAGQGRESPKPRKQRRVGWYLSGPIPGDWLSRAAALPGRALHVALAVQHGLRLNRSEKVKLTRRLLDCFGVNRKAAYRGLLALETAGLIAIEERGRGRCPVVRILESAE